MAAEWTDALADFERNLNAWMGRAAEPPDDPGPRPSEPVLLRMYDERLKRLQAHLDQAERDAGLALAPLADDVQALQQGLEALRLARAKLAERTARGVG